MYFDSVLELMSILHDSVDFWQHATLSDATFNNVDFPTTAGGSAKGSGLYRTRIPETGYPDGSSTPRQHDGCVVQPVFQSQNRYHLCG